MGRSLAAISALWCVCIGNCCCCCWYRAPPVRTNRSNQMKSYRKTHTHNICGVSTYKELLFIFHQNRFLLNKPAPCAERAFNMLRWKRQIYNVLSPINARVYVINIFHFYYRLVMRDRYGQARAADADRYEQIKYVNKHAAPINLCFVFPLCLHR